MLTGPLLEGAAELELQQNKLRLLPPHSWASGLSWAVGHCDLQSPVITAKTSLDSNRQDWAIFS